MARMTKVEAALSWAFQHGYVGAQAAAVQYAEQVGCEVQQTDGGLYADWLTFSDEKPGYTVVEVAVDEDAIADEQAEAAIEEANEFRPLDI